MSTAGTRPPVPVFLVLGVIGFVAGTGLAVLVAARSGGAPTVVVGMAAVAASVFLLVAFATKIITGIERLTFYHHAIGLVLGVVAYLAAVGAPLARNLDYAVLGLLVVMVFGRIGCSLVGCCHGRPASWGHTYRVELVDEGFPPHLVGVRLLPVQVAESVVCAGITAASVAGILAGRPPGTAFVWSAVAYVTWRFGIEPWRGDERGHRAGLSVPQWTSVGLAVSVAVSCACGALPGAALAAASAAALVLAAAVVGVGGPGVAAELVAPTHVREVAGVLDAHAAGRGPGGEAPTRWLTRGGLVLSTTEHLEDGDRPVLVYTLSHLWQPLGGRAVGRLARTIMYLRHATRDYSVLPGGPGVFHLVVLVDGVEQRAA